MAKILILGKYYAPFEGGIEQNTKIVAERLAHDHSVTAVVFNHEPGNTMVEHSEGIRVVRTRTLFVLKSQPVGLSYFTRTLSEDADIILFHAPNVLGSLALLIRLMFSSRRPGIVIVHHMDIFGRPRLRFVARQLYNCLLRRADRLVVTSEKNARISADIWTQCPLEVVPLGIDPQDYQVDQEILDIAAGWRSTVAHGRRIVGFVGRHARYKGLDVLIQSMLELPDVHLLLGGDGPYRASAEALSASLGLSDRVTFLGRLSHREKLALLKTIDVFAFPSTEITEAFGISQLEAMAMGVPVVASSLPTGVTDVSVDGQTALLAQVGDPHSLASRISELLGDPELSRRLADNAFARLHKCYSLDVTTRRSVEVINGVLADKGMALASA